MLEIKEEFEDNEIRIEEVEVDKGQVTDRIDRFLSTKLEKVSRTKIQSAANTESLFVNGKPVKCSYKIMPLDKIKIILPKPYGYENVKAEEIPLDIVFEDDDLLVLNKKPGIVVHPGVGNYTGTLVNALLYHIKHFDNVPDNFRAGIVHRLDKDTSGLMVVAKTEYSHAFLAKQFFEKTNKRVYHALVWGDVENETGKIENFIGRHKVERKKMAVYQEFENDSAKLSITNYKVLERFGYTTLIECILETGRTHQIRVHMASIGHPVFNDNRYGGDHIVKGTIFSKYKQFVDNCFSLCPRQALHAKELGFEHPSSKNFMDFDSSLPQDFNSLLEKWRNYSKGRI